VGNDKKRGGASAGVGQALDAVRGFHDAGSAIFACVPGFGENVVPFWRLGTFRGFGGARLVHCFRVNRRLEAGGKFTDDRFHNTCYLLFPLHSCGCIAEPGQFDEGSFAATPWFSCHWLAGSSSVLICSGVSIGLIFTTAASREGCRPAQTPCNFLRAA